MMMVMVMVMVMVMMMMIMISNRPYDSTANNEQDYECGHDEGTDGSGGGGAVGGCNRCFIFIDVNLGCNGNANAGKDCSEKLFTPH